MQACRFLDATQLQPDPSDADPGHGQRLPGLVSPSVITRVRLSFGNPAPFRPSYPPRGLPAPARLGAHEMTVLSDAKDQLAGAARALRRSQLATGPGHITGTSMPGSRDFAVAAHAADFQIEQVP